MAIYRLQTTKDTTASRFHPPSAAQIGHPAHCCCPKLVFSSFEKCFDERGASGDAGNLELVCPAGVRYRRAASLCAASDGFVIDERHPEIFCPFRTQYYARTAKRYAFIVPRFPEFLRGAQFSCSPRSSVHCITWHTTVNHRTRMSQEADRIAHELQRKQ